MTTACNYVVFFPEIKRIKFGITSNFKRRMAEYRKQASQYKLGNITFSRAPAELGIVRITETELRRCMSDGVTKGHFEWLDGDYAAFDSLVKATRRMQIEVAALLNGGVNA